MEENRVDYSELPCVDRDNLAPPVDHSRHFAHCTEDVLRDEIRVIRLPIMKNECIAFKFPCEKKFAKLCGSVITKKACRPHSTGSISHAECSLRVTPGSIAREKS